MHEVNNRLAALTNLFFVTRILPDCAASARSPAEVLPSFAWIQRSKRLTWSISLLPRSASITSRFRKRVATCRRGPPNQHWPAQRKAKSSRQSRICCSTPSRHCLIREISMCASPFAGQIPSSRLRTMVLGFRSRCGGRSSIRSRAIKPRETDSALDRERDC
jgi:hypothetical protein